MLVLSVSDVKDFMKKLLRDSDFDDFQLKNVVINSFARFEIFGVQKNGYTKWGLVRPHVFAIVRGSQQPKSIKVILGRDAEAAGVHNALSLFMNIYFQDGKITITTGISKKTFSLDKHDDEKWGTLVMKFLDDHGIKFTNEI